jgi:transcriptional regulator with XRE-family HTH domain
VRPHLIQERKRHKITQEEAANFLNITTQHYQRLESGDSDGSVKIWERLSQRFGVSINLLLAQDVGTEQPDYINSNPDGVEEIRELESAVNDFDLDVDSVLDIAKDGRLDDPHRRKIMSRLLKAMERVLGGAA